ncbi:tetratricopeptide repeat protein 21B-like, partial [Diorhabda carinulata]|uniref:tetratricopeptide repeat protein 21B-like n=1 Tax=Diorhabda carinulata TaxID=1163345 RepID=UPI0025A2D316
KLDFLEYYEDLLETKPNLESYILLGEAYMEVLEPDRALEIYEKALIRYPNQWIILSILGETLIRTHYFERAILFYQQHIKVKTNFKLKLVELYLSLKHYQKAELLLLELQEEEDYLNDFEYRLKILMFLAQTQEATENISHAIKNLEKATGICEKLINEDETLINTIIKLGELTFSSNEKEQTVNLYKKWLNHYPANIKILLALAKVYLLTNNFIQCEETSLQVLQIDPYNESAAIILIDISIREINFDTAISQCKQFLVKQPCNLEVLIRLVNLFKITGNLENSFEYLKKPTGNRRFILYVEGLYLWYTGDLKSAVKNFNTVKEDTVFGLNALYNLIDIYLSIENFLTDDNLLEKNVVDIYLTQLRIKLGYNYEKSSKYNIYKNKLLIFTREKNNIEQALKDLKSNDVCTILTISMGLIQLNQQKLALNQLKLICEIDWTPENSNYLENSWLLLADIYIKSNKFENGLKFLQKILRYNKSSCKTHEYLGLVFEKLQNIENAVIHYTLAWKLGRKINVPVGIRLAINLMKYKKYPTAVIVAKEILEINPDDNMVKEEILEKCLSSLRC